MRGPDDLFLHEEALLLALQDKKGTIASGTQLTFGLGGAILAELMLGERIRAVKPKKTQLAELVSSARMGDPVLDECLQKVRDAKKRASLQNWVSRFANLKQLRHRVAEHLAARGVLRVDQDKILGIFTRKIYPEIDPGPEKRIIERLRQTIFHGVSEVDTHTVALISLAHHTGLLKVVFDKRKLKDKKTRIEKIMNGDLTAKATREAIEAMQAAVFVACIMPTLIVATMHH